MDLRRKKKVSEDKPLAWVAPVIVTYPQGDMPG